MTATSQPSVISYDATRLLPRVPGVEVEDPYLDAWMDLLRHMGANPYDVLAGTAFVREEGTSLILVCQLVDRERTKLAHASGELSRDLRMHKNAHYTRRAGSFDLDRLR